MSLPCLILVAALDGQAALQHAAALAALGPHPWGSPRGPVAAEYVASQFRAAGLQEVRLQPFESHGIKGTNVIGVLRAPGPEFVVLAAHHDTAPAAPGAYDDGAGVGILIEAGRILARVPSRPRTLVFVSFDGEEAWSTGKTTTAGSRAYVQSLGNEARNLAGALVVEMSGFKGGTPVLHPIAYADPLKPGRSVIAPGWLVGALLAGSRDGGAPLGLGDPWLAWLYQPAVRTFRVRLYGDDLSFVQAGLPAAFVSDSSFTAFYPWYHQATDTPDKLDAGALGRMGASVLAAVSALERMPRSSGADPAWFAAGPGAGRGMALRPRRALRGARPPGRALAGRRCGRRALAPGRSLRPRPLAAPGAGGVGLPAALPRRPRPAPVAPGALAPPAAGPPGAGRRGGPAGLRLRRLALGLGGRGGAPRLRAAVDASARSAGPAAPTGPRGAAAGPLRVPDRALW